MRDTLRQRGIVGGLSLLLLSASLAHGDTLRVPVSNPGKSVSLEVSSLMGAVEVRAADVREVIVEVEPRKGRPEREHPDGMRRLSSNAVGVEVEEHDNRVSITGPRTRAARLEITVPANTSAKLTTLHAGDVVVEGLVGALELHNTNGGIRATNVRGPVSASTVNGGITVVFSEGTATREMAFTTLNGNVDITLPADFRANVRMRTENGEIYSDFEVAMASRSNSREEGRYHVIVSKDVSGTINGGGSELQLRTFNGDILLRRAER